jgi:hypothetical protein
MRQRFVWTLILEHNLALMGLVETKVMEVNMGEFLELLLRVRKLSVIALLLKVAPFGKRPWLDILYVKYWPTR